MQVVAVNTAVGNEPEQMKTMATGASERFLHDLVARQFAVRDRFVNSGEVLINNPPSTQVKMSNFRIAHLSIRQTDIGPAGAQFTAWIVPVELVVKWRPREKRCVSIFFALLPAAGINAPAIANNEHDWARHMWRSLPTIRNIDKQFFLP
jgi:hypothetical protein